MVYVDPTIPLPAEPSYTFPRPPFLCPSQVGTWHFLPAPTDLLISHFDKRLTRLGRPLRSSPARPSKLPAPGSWAALIVIPGFEHIAAWKRCCDMQKVCGNILEDRKRCNVQPNLNVHQKFSQILWLNDDI